MFRYARCNTVSAPNEKSFVIVIETRTRVYPPRNFVNFHRTFGMLDDPGGKGVETRRAAVVCKACRGSHATV